MQLFLRPTIVLLAIFNLLTAYTCQIKQVSQPVHVINDSSISRIELIGKTSIAGNAIDKSGLTEKLDADTTNEMLGGFSATTYSGNGDEYYYLSDRGAKDGAVDWQCRFHRVRISISKGKTPSVKKELVETIMLKDSRGLPMTGLAAAYQASASRSARLDPEGIRVMKNGNILISDEYGPRLIEFTRSGKFVREFEMPGHLLIKNPGLAKIDENPKNRVGRATNRGMEGLALSNDHASIFGLMQSPLLQDSSLQNPAKPLGLHCRLFQFSQSGEPEKELVYKLDSAANKLNEILSVGSGQFIVIERDGEIGNEAKFKKLMLVSTDNATDVSGVSSLPPFGIPNGIRPVKKRVLIDLLDPRWNLAGSDMPEKIEGLAFGPDLDDGRKLLIVTSDNDFESANPSYTYAFAVPKHLLH